MTSLYSHQKSISEILDQLEIDVSKLGQLTDQKAKNILFSLDEVSNRFDELHAKGVSQTGDEAQFEYILDNLKKNSKNFIKDIGGIHNYVELRSQREPDPVEWWWFLDEIQKQRKKAQQKRTFITAGIIVIVLVAFVVVYQHFLAPDPITQAEYTYESNVQSLLSSGDYSDAFNQAVQGLSIVPQDANLWILKGIAQTMLGDTTSAKDSYTQAETLLGNHKDFLLSRAIILIRTGDAQSALTDAQAAIEIDSQSAEAYFYKATALQNMGQDQAAYDAYNTASDLALKEGNDQLVATIRINIALLLQQLDIMTTTTQTPVVTP